MNLIFFAAWVVAGAVLLLPLGMFVRLGRRLMGRGRAGRRNATPARTALVSGVREASSHAGSLQGEEPRLTAAAVPGSGVTQPAHRRTQRLASVFSFLLYVAFIAGAVYYIPQILSWVLDTPHPMASVSSQSMWPTLRKGDLIFLRGVDKAEDLEIGDIIAFRHEKGITVHRVLEIDGDIITTQGDANPVADEPVRFDQVVGRVITIGGRVAKVPHVGSIAGLFGPLTSQAGQSPGQEESSADGSSSPPAPVEFGASISEQPSGSQPVNPSPGTTELVSVDSSGNEANGFSNWAAISADGRFVAFASDGSNVVPGDTNGRGDIFVHDRQTGITERVSVDSAGRQAGGGSGKPAISADGRFVAFESAASDLVPGDSNGQSDIFVHDRQTGITERMSVDSAGNQAGGGSGKAAISAGGRFVAFESAASNLVPDDTNAESDVYVHDRQTGITARVSVDGHGNEGDDRSTWPAISADGRFVAFESMATNLVSRDFNRDQDIFVHDRRTGATERVSVSKDGKQASSPSDVPAISADGRFVAFASGARNLVAGDMNRFYFADVFVHDRQTGATERVSANSAGNQGNDYSGLPAISADGRFVAFLSLAGDLAPVAGYGQHVFVRDRGAAGAGGSVVPKQQGE